MQWLTEVIFQDSARPHTARVSQDCLRTVTTFPWPSRSPNLSPIEHIWDNMGWRVAYLTSLNELEASSLHLRPWVERNTLKKLGVARTLEKSAYP
ncbi:transposable element Tcb2 transposase [Trichonephila clavipes]|nr:transposable element Tcb2 transposase [Trichonephila clavipes]